jgi:hypothetical protein
MRRPHQITAWAKSSILELWVCVDNEIIITNDSKITTSWSNFDSLGESLTLTEFLYILGFDYLTVLGRFVSTR